MCLLLLIINLEGACASLKEARKKTKKAVGKAEAVPAKKEPARKRKVRPA